MSIWRHLSVRTGPVVTCAVVFFGTVWAGVFGLAGSAAINRQAAAMHDNRLSSAQSGQSDIDAALRAIDREGR